MYWFIYDTLRQAKVTVLLPVLLGIGSTVQAQVAPASSALVQQAQQVAVQAYRKAIDDQSQLYNGTEYFDYTRFYEVVEGHQFYPSETEQPGTLTYQGHSYEGVPLRYDTHLDQVIVKHPSSLFYVNLLAGRISSFSLGSRNFTRLGGAVAEQAAGSGFYEVLLSADSVRLLAKRYKNMLDQPAQNKTRVVFSSADRYFLQTKDNLRKINSKQSVLAAFPGQKKLLQRHIRDKHLFKNRQLREQDLVHIVLYRSTLPD